MSLINQVLRDLDARSPEYGPVSRLPTEVRPLPKARRLRLPFLAVALVIVFIALCGAAAASLGVFRGDLAGAQVLAGPLLQLPATRPLTPAPVQPGSESAPAASPDTSSETVARLSPEPEPGLRLTDSLQLASAPSSLPAAPAAVSDGVLVRAKVRKPADQKDPQKAAAAAAANPLAARATVREADARNYEARNYEARKDDARNHESRNGDARRDDPRENDSGNAAPPAPTARPAASSRIEKSEARTAPGERAESEYRKAIAVLNQGRVAEALEVLRNALALDGLHAASRQLLAKLLLEGGRDAEAIEVLQEGLRAQPAQIAWATSVARLQVERHDLEGAWRTLAHSLPAASKHAEYQGFAAHVLQRLGRNAEAADCYRLAAELAPADGRWWLGLGLALEATRRPDEAREAFSRAQASKTLGGELAALVEQKLR